MIEHKAVQLSFPEKSEEYSAPACSGVAPHSSSLTHFFSKNKVVPRSAVNPDHLEPFNCKGLFTTTHAINNARQASPWKRFVTSNEQPVLTHPRKWIGGPGCRIATRGQVRLALVWPRVCEPFLEPYLLTFLTR